jgi:hypothetical protein
VSLATSARRVQWLLVRSRRAGRSLAGRPAVNLMLGVFAILTGLSCGGDLVLAVGSLTVAPNPAVPGQPVVLTFRVTVIPEHNFEIAALIDDVEHVKRTYMASINGLLDFTIGDAEDLISAFGVGNHTARVEVRFLDSSHIARGRPVSFELAAAPAGMASP